MIALDVTGNAIDLGDLLQGTARRFAPHITLLPRFPLRSDTADAGMRRWLDEAVADLAFATIALIGPREPEPDLTWYETAAGDDGRARLHRVHAALLHHALSSGLLDAEPRFAGSRYHPHMTVRWRAPDPPIRDMPARLLVRGCAVALYRYAADPHRDPVLRHSLVEWSPASR